MKIISKNFTRFRDLSHNDCDDCQRKSASFSSYDVRSQSGIKDIVFFNEAEYIAYPTQLCDPSIRER